MIKVPRTPVVLYTARLRRWPKAPAERQGKRSRSSPPVSRLSPSSSEASRKTSAVPKNCLKKHLTSREKR